MTSCGVVQNLIDTKLRDTKKELVHNQLDDTVKSQKEMSYFVWPDKSVDVASIFFYLNNFIKSFFSLNFPLNRVNNCLQAKKSEGRRHG